MSADHHTGPTSSASEILARQNGKLFSYQPSEQARIETAGHAQKCSIWWIDTCDCGLDHPEVICPACAAGHHEQPALHPCDCACHSTRKPSAIDYERVGYELAIGSLTKEAA